jgi:DNA-binding FadR family transcriptional regulator
MEELIKPRVHQQVLQVLGKEIVMSLFKEGELLPSEAYLCERFNIGRNSLREVFKVLNQKGLIESIPKLGTRVTSALKWNIFDKEIIQWSKKTKLYTNIINGLNEARTSIEPLAAKYAAERSNALELSEIENSIDRMRNYPSDSREYYLADLDFHLSILSASQNLVWMHFGKILSSALIHTFKENNIIEQRDEIIQIHESVFEAIRMREAKKAESRMIALLKLGEINTRIDKS